MRNGRLENSRSNKPKYNRRIRELAYADEEFMDDLQSNTNFMIGDKGRSRRRVGTAGMKHAPTILSQVKKYGIEDHLSKQFVRTEHGVTDDPERYVARTSDFDHSYVDPKPKEPPKDKKSKRMKKAEAIRRDIQAHDFADQNAKTKGNGANALTVGGGELSSARDAMPKPMFNILSNPELNTRNQKEVDSKQQPAKEPAGSEGGLDPSKITLPQSDTKIRASNPLSFAS